MNKKIFILSTLAVCLSVHMNAQVTADLDRKWDGIAERSLKSSMKAARSGQSTSVDKKGFVISCRNAVQVVDKIQKDGFKATIIGDGIVSAKFPAYYLRNLAKNENVKYINGARQFRSTMHTTRKVTGVDSIHNSDEFETPFTGKGVIVGVIDQGFEYRHAAFSDKNGNSRVRAVWDHYNKKAPTTEIPTTGDRIKNSYGHATHVTNIAAGSKVRGNEFYGIAPNAEIVMIPSTFLEDEVLEEAKYIKDMANKEGKPFVINMSFGSQVGPHDGTGAYCEGMDAISQKGGILVAAMGNEGMMPIHGHHIFTKANEKVYIVAKPSPDEPYNVLDLWGQNADGKQHLKITPKVYNTQTKIFESKNDAFWDECAYLLGDVYPFNNKEYYFSQVEIAKLQKGFKNKYFALEIVGNPGDEFHAWFNPDCGEFYRGINQPFVPGNDKFCVGEGAATIPQAIAVAAFNGNDGTFISMQDGKKYSLNPSPIINREGTICDFSSRGPLLGEKEPKPLVAAPGHAVASAVSKYSDFNAKNRRLVSAVSGNGSLSLSYYGMMSGTSMASPAVAGIVALWLEAYPEMTYEQVKQIIKETASVGEIAMGNADKKWHDDFGYGKIDAYAGLKKALELAEGTGINDLMNSETPITLLKRDNVFRILFNNDETYATISLYNASGVEVKRETLQQIRRGNETVISADGLPAGVYVVCVRTTSSMLSKKMMVK